MKNKLSKTEQSLLMFLEYVAVDLWGWVDDVRKLNKEDMEIAIKWDENGFIFFKRASRDRNGKKELTYIVKLSNEAWNIAHQLRKEKSLRHIPEPFNL